MVTGSTANKETFEVTTLSELEICLTRLFDAPRPLVFEAMTKTEHVKKWWGRLGEGYCYDRLEDLVRELQNS